MEGGAPARLLRRRLPRGCPRLHLRLHKIDETSIDVSLNFKKCDLTGVSGKYRVWRSNRCILEVFRHINGTIKVRRYSNEG